MINYKKMCEFYISIFIYFINVLTNGIDVSQYQGLINWEVVKNHIDFAIIRCGYGQDIIGQDDELFKRNADECTRLNIPFGVYLYSYAKNVETSSRYP